MDPAMLPFNSTWLATEDLNIPTFVRKYGKIDGQIIEPNVLRVGYGQDYQNYSIISIHHSQITLPFFCGGLFVFVVSCFPAWICGFCGFCGCVAFVALPCFAYLSIYLSVCLSVYRSIDLSIYLSII